MNDCRKIMVHTAVCMFTCLRMHYDNGYCGTDSIDVLRSVYFYAQSLCLFFFYRDHRVKLIYLLTSDMNYSATKYYLLITSYFEVVVNII